MLAAILFAIDPKPLQLKLLREADWIGMAAMAIGLGSFVAMLEEGQRQHWFGSEFIQRCAWLSAIFIPAFIFIELRRKNLW